MIEINKQNENYEISESEASNGWSMTGNATKSVDGTISINFSVTKPGELDQSIGDLSYFKYVESPKVNVNYNVSEENRDNFVTYVDTVLDTVLAKFQEE